MSEVEEECGGAMLLMYIVEYGVQVLLMCMNCGYTVDTMYKKSYVAMSMHGYIYIENVIMYNPPKNNLQRPAQR